MKSRKGAWSLEEGGAFRSESKRWHNSERYPWGINGVWGCCFLHALSLEDPTARSFATTRLSFSRSSWYGSADATG